MILGGYVASKLQATQVDADPSPFPEAWTRCFGNSCRKRYWATFIGGVLVLFGARLAGGCSSGHMMSGMMQTSLSGYLFALGSFSAAVPMALYLYKKGGGNMSIVLAIILGFLFGFVLQKVGAANPQRIIQMLRLQDFHLAKAILLGIGFSSLGLFILLSIGVIDASHISVKPAYFRVLVGGGIFGLGWAISGFCPGTGVVALGTGRKDAVFFIGGGLFGALLFMLLYAPLKSTFFFADWGGKTSIASTGNEKFVNLLPAIPSILIAGLIAAIFMAIAWKLPEKSNE